MKAFTLFIISVAFSFNSTAQVTLSGALTGSFPTVKQAFDAINAGGGSGNVTVTIIANTTETAQVVLNPNGYTVLVIPQGNRIIEGSIADALILLSGTANVVIDGLSQTGANTLTIRNTNTGNIANAIRIQGASANNTIKRCIIEAACNGNLTRTAAVAVSVDNEITTDNIIDSNWIRPSASTGLKGGIIVSRLSAGITAGINNTQITNNRIENAFIDESLGNYGIAVGQNVNNTVIKGNSIYNSNTYTNNLTGNEATYSGITFASASGSGSGCIVDSNYIGGTAPTALGGKMLLTSFQRQMFIGIAINNSIVSNPVSITRNIIRNVEMTSRNPSTITMNPFRGIQVAAANLQAYNHNVVGSETNNSIVINQMIASTGGMSSFGHLIQVACATPVENNFIGGLNITHLRDGVATGVHALTLFVVAGNIPGINIKNNTIGAAVADNIVIANGAVAMGVSGFQVNSINASPVISIDSNVVRNIKMTGTVVASLLTTVLNNDNVTNATISSNGNTISAVSLSGDNGSIAVIRHDANAPAANLTRSLNVNGNFINNITIPGGINSNVHGIRVTNFNTAASNPLRGRITDNEIDGLLNTATGAAFSVGMNIFNTILSTDSLVLANNIIKNVSASSANVFADSRANSTGLLYETTGTSLTGPVVVRDNVLHDIRSLATDAAAVTTYGLASFGNNIIAERNRIFNLSNAATSSSAKISAIHLRSRNPDANVAMLSNNMIAINTTTAARVAGIDMADGVVNAKVYHNSVLAEGNFDTNSYGLFKSATATADVKNTILYNAATGAGTAFAIGLETNVTGYAGNNNYFVSPATESLAQIAAASHTLATWQTATSQDVNAQEGQSGVTTNAADLYLNKATGILMVNNGHATEPAKASDKGMALSVDVPADFFNNIRSASTPDIGAHEFVFSVVTPLNLISFSGSKQNYSAQLQWRTVNEVNVSHFELQRSDDGQSFTTIGTVQSGNSLYNYTDANVFATKQVVFYRLKSVDLDGKFTLSAVVRLTAQPLLTLSVFPNPVQDVITITGLKQNGTIRLFNASGKLLQQQTVTAQSTTMNLGGYAKGIYVLQYQQGGEIVNQKIVKQ